MRYKIKFQAAFIREHGAMPMEELEKKLAASPYTIRKESCPGIFGRHEMIVMTGVGPEKSGDPPSEGELYGIIRKDLDFIPETAVIDAAVEEILKPVDILARAKMPDGSSVEIPLDDILKKAFPDGARGDGFTVIIRNASGERLEAAFDTDREFPGISVDGYRKNENGEDLFWLCSAELPNSDQPGFTARLYAGCAETEVDSPVALVSAALRKKDDKSKKAVFVDLDEADCWYMNQAGIGTCPGKGFPSTSGECREIKKAGR